MRHELRTSDIADTEGRADRQVPRGDPRRTRETGAGNVPDETVWLNIGRGQQIHVFYVEGFEVSPFEREFGRHVALFHPLPEFAALKARLASAARNFRAAARHAVRALLLQGADQRLRLRGRSATQTR